MESLVNYSMAKWENRHVLVTGATGLVGSWLVKRLIDEGALVTALILDYDPQSELIRSANIKKINVVNGNLANFRDVQRAVLRDDIDCIFHLGAQTIVGTALKDPVSTFESNVQGTWNVLEAARLAGDKVKSVLVASSDKAYGTAPRLPYAEDMPLRGDGPYDVSKSATDLIARSYGVTYNLPVVIARCGNIFGGGDLNWSRIVPGTIRSLLLGEIPEIRSDGKYVRDYVHVEDAVDAYLHMANAMETKQIAGEAFNFSRDEPISVLELYDKICEVTVGKRVEPRILNQAKAEIHSQHLDSGRARRELGWNSKITLTEGLKRTVSWYRDFLGNV
jgi:CDP-glucose 4,6-dehydratase